MDPSNLGRLLLISGALLCVVGLVFMLAGRVPLLGRLPGDLVFERDGVTVFIPFATMILVSVVLTLVVNLAARLFR